MTPLAAISRTRVPPEALRHPFVRELDRAITGTDRDTRVVGTDNGKPAVQLYGWRSNVPAHTDATGWVYFVPLSVPENGSLVGAGEATEVLKVGIVYRLNDSVTHYTYETGGRVRCIFAGPFKKPDDARAKRWLRRGLQRLADCKDWGAPRVSHGWRTRRLPGECYVMAGYCGVDAVRIEEAKRKGIPMLRCERAGCGRLADIIDNQFPYHWERNRCRRHQHA